MKQNKIDLMIGLAKDTHQDDRYARKNYFDTHLEGVVSIVIYNFKPTYTREFKDLLIIVGYGHDLLEDHPHLINYDLLLTWFGKEVADAILAISKRPNELHSDYLDRVKSNELARLVKIADSTFNMYNCIIENNFKKARYYENNIKYLTDV